MLLSLLVCICSPVYHLIVVRFSIRQDLHRQNSLVLNGKAKFLFTCTDSSERWWQGPGLCMPRNYLQREITDLQDALHQFTSCHTSTTWHTYQSVLAHRCAHTVLDANTTSQRVQTCTPARAAWLQDKNTNYKTASLSVSTLSLREDNSPTATFTEQHPTTALRNTHNLPLTSLEQTHT